MFTQVVGALIAVLGFCCLVGSIADIERRPGPPLLGAIGFVGGMILVALSRIQFAIRPPTEAEARRMRVAGWVSFGVVLLVMLAGALAVFLKESPAELSRTSPAPDRSGAPVDSAGRPASLAPASRGGPQESTGSQDRK